MSVMTPIFGFIKKIKNAQIISCIVLFFFCAFIFFTFGDIRQAQAVVGVPEILVQQGRLLNASGDLLGGAGTPYCFRFSIYDASTGGSKVWPSTDPSTMTITVKNGVFSAPIGGGADTLNFNFQDNDTVYLNVDVATKVGATCDPGDGAESFESLTPRQQIVSSGFAINANTIGGFAPSQTAGANQIPVLNSSGNLVLGTGAALQISIAGDPGTPAAGMIWYDSGTGKYKIREGSTTKILCNTTDAGCGAGGATNWNTIGDATAAGEVLMGEFAQDLTWNMATDVALNALEINMTHDFSDTTTQKIFVVANIDDAAAVGTLETMLSIDNRDANEVVTNGLLVENTAAGTLTNAIQIAETAGTITDGILITGTLGNILNSASIDITGAGAITGATGITSSGTITFSGLTADRLVSTTTGGALAVSISSANAALSVSDETGSGLLVFGTSPTLAGVPVIGDGAGNDNLSFSEEATDPACAAGDLESGQPLRETSSENAKTEQSPILIQEAEGEPGILLETQPQPAKS